MYQIRIKRRTGVEVPIQKSILIKLNWTRKSCPSGDKDIGSQQQSSLIMGFDNTYLKSTWNVWHYLSPKAYAMICKWATYLLRCPATFAMIIGFCAITSWRGYRLDYRAHYFARKLTKVSHLIHWKRYQKYCPFQPRVAPLTGPIVQMLMMNPLNNILSYYKENGPKTMWGNVSPNLKAQFCQCTLKFEPQHEISNNVVCATSKASDQPAHMRSLIRAFASRLNILWLLSYWLNIIWSF